MNTWYTKCTQIFRKDVYYLLALSSLFFFLVLTSLIVSVGLIHLFVV